MKTILDEIEEVKNEKKTYSRLSFINSVISIGLILFFSLFPSDAFIKPYPLELRFVLLFFLISGIIMAILSIAKKEPNNWMKWIGAILNIAFFMIVLGLIIYIKTIYLNMH